MTTSQSLTIFEGPDGGGKSTAARWYADAIGAQYVHFPALPQVSSGLARMYVEAMVPALLGHRPVVFDRCWMSEVPYGTVFRGGKNRMVPADVKMLERLAMRCGGVIIRCMPPSDVCVETYRKRKNVELLDNEEQLRQVYFQYQLQTSELPIVEYNFTRGSREQAVMKAELSRMPRHLVHIASAGNLNASTVLVGEAFCERKDHDPWYQWPFASFSSEGCSRWLTNELIVNGIAERDLFWVNADQDLSICTGKTNIIAMGTDARLALAEAGFSSVHAIHHPQFWKRFKSKEPYTPLIERLEPK